jgi:uncharacterized protein (DUF427 family)
MTTPQPFVEATERRVRVRLGGHVVADSRRALLLVEYGPRSLPTYYLPRDDVRPDALVDERADPEGGRRWSVVAGHARAEDAAWTHPAATGAMAPLADHVTFSWRALEWFEEDEQVLVHARDPYKRVDVLRSSRHVQVLVDDVEVANSHRPLLLFETSLPTRYDLPFEDVRSELFVASDLVTRCPYKGTARYWSVSVGSTIVPDLAWSYPDPIPENPKIKDHVCFFNERVTLVVDGEEQPRPVTHWTDAPAGRDVD